MHKAVEFAFHRLPTVALVAVLGFAPAAVAKEAKGKDKTVKDKQSIKVKKDGGYLGVYMQELDDDVREGLDAKTKHGVLVSGVEDDSPAEKAGIEEGDIIVSVDGQKVATPDELRDAMRGLEPGEETTVELVRDGKSKSLNVTVGDREHSSWFSFETPEAYFRGPVDAGRSLAFFGGPRLGVQAHEIDDDGLAAYFGTKAGDGVLVLGVEENSVAGKAGVQPGDIIRQVGDEKVSDVRDLREAVRDYDAGDEFTIGVLRRGKTESLKATMDEETTAFHVPPVRWRDMHSTPAPRVRVYDRQRIQNDIRDEINDLREEIEELKEQLERKDG